MLLKSLVSFSSLVLTFCFTIFLYLLFVCMMSRRILRCVDCIILSCSLVCVCPCSRRVAYCRSYCCVEQPETMFEHVVFRCQLLPVFVKCRPGSPDTIPDFGRLLFQERNLIWPKYLTLSPLVFSTFMSSTSFSFFFVSELLVACWLLRIFVFSG